MHTLSDTIVAIATPPGQGAIGIIRLSGDQAIAIVNRMWSGKDLSTQPTHTIHFGRIMDGNTALDEVVVSLYRAPRSYTGEEVVELSCHGSDYVLEQVMGLSLRHGARLARPGEYTLRAFLNGKLDLTQAEAVADLIASHTGTAHKAAMHTLRGGFKHELEEMREQLVMFSALIELELDFSQEDVEFADRTQFYQLIDQLTKATQRLVDSFKMGNVIKNGVNVAITGRPNAGKSTLLNTLLNEERAIVSEIAGTTRDTIEEVLNINGLLFRLVDTAGIREHTTDVIELQGIERSRQAMQRADVVILLLDATDPTLATQVAERTAQMQAAGQQYLLVVNKVDAIDPTQLPPLPADTIYLSARNKQNINLLRDALYQQVASGALQTEGTIVTNTRHHAALLEVLTSLHQIKEGLDTHLPSDLIALTIRHCLYHLGEITGTVTNEEKLDYIFGKFCIGK